MKKQTLSPAINSELVARGVDTSALIYFLYGDMDRANVFCDTCAAFDEKNLYILTGFEKVVKKSGVKKLITIFDTYNFEAFSLAELGKITVERMISTGRLISEKDGGLKDLFHFSIGLAAKMDGLAGLINAQVSGEPLDFSPIVSQDELQCPVCGTRYPEENRKICPKCLNKTSLTLRLMSFFKQYNKNVAAILICISLSAAFNIITPLLTTKVLFGYILTPGAKYYGLILEGVIAIVISATLGKLVGIISGRLVAKIMPRIIFNIKKNIFSAMQRLSMSFFSGKQTGSLLSRVDNDSENVLWFFVDGVPYLIVNSLTFLGVLIVMFILSWQLALILFGFVPILCVAFLSVHRTLGRLHHRTWIRGSRLISFLSDAVNGVRVIKAFSKEDEAEGRFNRQSGNLYSAQIGLNNAFAGVDLSISFFFVISNSMIFLFGGIFVIHKQIDFSTFLAFSVFMNYLLGPLGFFTWVSNWWSRCMDSCQRMFEIIDTEPDLKEAENPVSLPVINGDIEVRGGCFEYEPGRPVIKDVSFSIKGGQMLGIVGKTGAGKSTIVNLLARLYDLSSGSITIDGVDIRQIKMSDLRRNIGIVSQEIYLFMGSIADNIRYACPEASIKKVIMAAKAASAHDFIIKLADGYDTEIGVGGQDLSGGEKQRISIARAIIQNPRVLILDEATAAMDTETERNIQNAISMLQKGRTTISIAHRLSTLREADMLAVIDEGKVVEFGTHLELINRKQEYYNLYKLQVEALKFIGIGD